ncbi:MAG: phenylalanine--tRNA ligase subunit beta [Oscillospiraceae bacterium]
MKLSRKWLSEFVDIDVSDKEYVDAMTLSGSKVEAVENLSAEIKNVVVGKVTEIRRHPDSDHMFICRVQLSETENVQIVTGAQNVRQGDIAPVAKHRSILPGGIKITKGKLRGEVSEGMLCSLKELNLDLHDFPYAIEDGIFILQDEGCKVGDDICPVIGADDTVVDFEITSNRPDCLSVIGLARETAVTFGAPLKLHTPVVKGSGGNISELLDVEIENGGLCPRYTARMIKNVKIAPSPKWMRQRLRACGVRPINNIVDITNYVMLEYGQPMHAFDFSCVEGGKIIVRTAKAGEIMKTLDGNDRALAESMLVIADANKPVGVAGVMGGANSEIVGDTAMVVFESANFNGVSIRRTATSLGMRTDASGRYEKGLDPMNTYKGVQRACELVELLGCGEVVDGIIDVIAEDREPTRIKLEPERINKLLGTDVLEPEMREILIRLGFEFDGDIIIVPSWRADVEHYSDIAEEVARFHGYNNLPATLMRGDATQGGFSEKQKTEIRIGRNCRAFGFSEIMTYSFISPSAYDRIRLPKDSKLRKSFVILNPLGEDTSAMRTVSLPSMLEILSRNKSYRNENVRLYELAKVYRENGEVLPDERVILTLGAYGGMDFFAMKGYVEAILSDLHVMNVSFTAESENHAYHPGRCAVIRAGDRTIGVIGQVHPKVADNYGLDETYAAELDLADALAFRAPERTYTPLPKFPSITRDIAVVCGADITIAALTDCIRRAGGNLLKDVKLFDIYTGSHIEPGKKSTAFSMKLRSDDKTLTDEDADGVVAGVLEKLKDELGAVIR